jgi:ribA/ribD-fused uncharacterized protein
MKYYSELLGATVYTDTTGHDIAGKYVFFYGGIFSQWAACDFIHTQLNVRVNCAEQAMMLSKAKTFNDMERYECILKSENPRAQKAMGRNIQNYDEKIWSEVRYNIVKQVNYDKFTQNKGWKELLLLTDPYLLVEASPTDRIWGIGMGEDNPDLLKIGNWGQNLLGMAITEVRNMIINEKEK